MKKYLLQILIAIDQCVNAIFGGWADETLSSRAYRKAVLTLKPAKGWVALYLFINLLFFSRKHCKRAYNSELERKHLASSMRTKTPTHK